MKREMKEGKAGQKTKASGGKGKGQASAPHSGALGYTYWMDDREEANRSESDSEWAITWGDLMMSMFVLFALLFIYKQSERDIMEAFRYANAAEGGTGTGGGVGPGVTPGDDGSSIKELLPEPSPDEPYEDIGMSPEKILQLAEDAAKDIDLEDVQVLLQDDKTIKISLRGPLLFDLGSAQLRENTKSFLSKVAGVLKKMSNEVHVEGHTDTFPIYSAIFPTNWELSVVRAAAVARYLIQEGPLEPGRFTVLGHSMYRPVLPNTTLQNKQLNRRVEIIITKKPYKNIPLM